MAKPRKSRARKDEGQVVMVDGVPHDSTVPPDDSDIVPSGGLVRPAKSKTIEHNRATLRDAAANPDIVTRVTSTNAGGRVAVSFHARETTRLEQIDYFEFGDITEEGMGVAESRVAGAFVKVSTSLRPSEREAFDGQALKARLRAAGARAVLLAVQPVAEGPDAEAKAEVVAALRPEDAIAAWFAGLPIPDEDKADATARALLILAAEGG